MGTVLLVAVLALGLTLLVTGARLGRGRRCLRVIAALGAVLFGSAVTGACTVAVIEVGFYVPSCETPVADASAPDGGPDPCRCASECDCFGDGGADYQRCLAALADGGASP